MDDAGRARTWLVRLVLPLAYRLTRWRKARGRLRALWGATPILTLRLKARATALLGMQSRTVVFETYIITRNFDYNLRLIANGAARLGPWASALADQLILAWALLRFDVIHYFHDRGLMRPIGRFGVRWEELDLLRKGGKAVYLFAYGADVRTRETTLALGRWNFCVDCPEPGRYCVCDEQAGLAAAREASSRVTATVSMADMLPYMPGSKYLDYWPIDTDALKAAAPPRVHGALRIAHAPNHTHFKGSRHLEAAIEKLRGEGHAIEYVKVQGVPNTEVLALFRSADIVADQFIGGAYGYTALEAMALGRPVLTYVRSPKLVEAGTECPLINVTPTTLEETLRWCLANLDRLPAIGAQGRSYVERWHSISAVAERLGRLYEATAELPDSVHEAIRYQRAAEQARRDTIATRDDWHHPFWIGSSGSPVVRAGEEVQEVPRPQPTPPSRSEALERLAEPAATRWSRAGSKLTLFDGWTSYDRTPWAHPWLESANVASFARFSRATLDRLAERVARLPEASRRFAFVGNLANIGWMRAAALRRQGLAIDVFPHPHDHSLMSQPFWEEFDGERADLGEDPFASPEAAIMPEGVRCEPVDAEWAHSLGYGTGGVPSATDILLAPEHMPFLPLLRALQNYDSLLVTQSLAFGSLARKPFVIGQSGGDIWFDPARGDVAGRLAEKALREAYAVLVSNPITLAHARRYGLSNCLYLPFSIDEERYRPGEEPAIRAEWHKRIGGEFFLLTSMRLDNAWKGAQIAIEGFARFAKSAPDARLVILGWGVDEGSTLQKLAHLGVAEKALLLPVVGKVRVARYLRAADCLIEQFVLGYFGASALEAMASGLPVVMRLERAQYEALSPAGAPPVLDAMSANEVAGQLLRLYQDGAFRREQGRALRQWFLATHAGRAAAGDYRTLLTAAAAGLSIDWSGSPLAAPLSEVERHYHRDQLAHAPRFPNYEI